MTNALRITSLLLILGLRFSSPAAGSIEPPAAPSRPSNTEALTVEEQQLVEEAQQLFVSAGLALPDITIEFPADPDRCFQNGGVYLPSVLAVRICRPSLKTMVHELAHSWVETTLTADERESFLKLRALNTWAGGERWDERGAEHAAEILTWAVMETDISIRWIETNADGTTLDTTRLFKIADSDHDELVSAYRQLTGERPHKRLAEGPATAAGSETMSPEAR